MRDAIRTVTTATAFAIFAALNFPGHALAGEITLVELTQKMQSALAGINDMSHTYSLKYRPKGSEYSNNKTLIEAKMWYRKPNLAREESVHLYAGKNEKFLYVIKLEGNVYNAYELFKDGTVKKTSHPAQEWSASGYTPEFFIRELKKRIDQDIPYSIEYQNSRDVYVLRFDAPDEAAFEIYGQSWLPYTMTVADGKNLVETAWSNIEINAGVPDAMFRVGAPTPGVRSKRALPAPPVASRPSPPDDDPIGPGGFITPPQK